MNLWTRLSLAFAAVIVLALVLAGTAFIVLRRGDWEREALAHLATVAPRLALDVRAAQRGGATDAQINDLIDEAARVYEVRVLLVRRDNTVVVDSDDTLTGRRIDVPRTGYTGARNYRTWIERTPDNKRTVFLFVPSVGFPQFRFGGRFAEPQDDIILAVPEQSLANAWRSLLPGLTVAGSIALVCSLLVAMLVARSIARPLELLTRASEAMTHGDFDQQIPVRRRDEVGRLAQAFNAMAREVGRGHEQMRALIANVSHDLKTPLTSILGFAQALRDRTVEEPEMVVEMGGIIHDEAQRVQALVEDLLYLSALDAGQVLLARDPVDLGALALRVERRFAPRMTERGLDLSVAAEPATLVQGDAAKLERVLDNLLDNALKYTPAKGSVRLGVTRTPADQVTVTVFNSGAQIPAEQIERIFDRFYRLDRARSSAMRGSGLGLAIARELVERHGGSLTAASNPDGVTMTLRLPAAQPPPSAEPAGPPPFGAPALHPEAPR